MRLLALLLGTSLVFSPLYGKSAVEKKGKKECSACKVKKKPAPKKQKKPASIKEGEKE